MQEQKANQKAIKLEKKHKVNAVLTPEWMTDGVGGKRREGLGEAKPKLKRMTPAHVYCWGVGRAGESSCLLLC